MTAADVMLPVSTSGAGFLMALWHRFDRAGLAHVVAYRETGYVAPMESVEGLVAGVEWVLADPGRAAQLSSSVRDEAARRFSVITQAEKYRDLYDEIAKS